MESSDFGYNILFYGRRVTGPHGVFLGLMLSVAALCRMYGMLTGQLGKVQLACKEGIKMLDFP